MLPCTVSKLLLLSASVFACVSAPAPALARFEETMPDAGARSLGGMMADTIPLPPVPGSGALSLEETIQNRRSIRDFRADSLSLEDISRLLWAAQGITDAEEGLRSAPSAGALYPLEIFVATGEYLARYLPEGHRLTVVREGDVRGPLAEACLDQKWVEDAPAVFIFISVTSRTAAKYGDRAERYVQIEVGCAAENLMLQAVGLGLGSVAVGAFDDKDVRKVLDLPKSWEPILVVPVGVPEE